MIADLRALEPPQLKDFTNSLVEQIVAAVTDKIPHLESSLAVAELTVALHYVLNTPEDVLVWDVGHQAYVHKALTGRMNELVNMRKPGGISGFLKRDESPYDFFGAGHASTSISALAGVCLADQIAKRTRRRVAVIGDGSLTGGQSFEALNHLGTLGSDALVIINDNEGSIDATIGALHNKQSYGAYVQALGWHYTFLEQGNDVRALVDALQQVLAQPGPQTLHIKTKRPDLSPPKSYKPGTTFQWWAACHESQEIGVVLITGEGPSSKDGGWAFCSGGDQRVRSNTGYKGANGINRFNILDVQRQIRFMNKVVIAVVPGWAVGGGHSLHVVCDLTLASKEHAVFKQTDADVASFDGGFGSAYLARQVGQKRAREIFFLGAEYSAQEAFEMGMVNKVVPHEELEQVAYEWAQEIMTKSPTAIKMLKFGFNLIDDGLVGQQVYAGEATRLAYGTEEAVEGRNAFLEKRPRDFSKFPKFP